MWFPWIALFGLFAIPTTFVYDVWDTLLRFNDVADHTFVKWTFK